MSWTDSCCLFLNHFPSYFRIVCWWCARVPIPLSRSPCRSALPFRSCLLSFNPFQRICPPPDPPDLHGYRLCPARVSWMDAHFPTAPSPSVEFHRSCNVHHKTTVRKKFTSRSFRSVLQSCSPIIGNDLSIWHLGESGRIICFYLRVRSNGDCGSRVPLHYNIIPHLLVTATLWIRGV